ncbi:MAG TPA: MarR family transcriptional regulator [Baekduia sp.]|uniref:MarR family winged helix-turn-helix transcriptional regulator n=1 Tax=Baekduia sp. TaxID=2600305 RepID=UPI002D79D78F|nr:MarR family transcriptional regulator [Baekduia sp.]HET6508446.1 MarR family transcriptional regulator [Baekduia sp.]
MKAPVPAETARVAGDASPATEAVRLAFVELMGAERRLRARDQKCAKGELTQSHIRALFAIDKSGEATAGDLAKAAELSPASVSAMLDHLERDGIVERHRSEHDRRVVVVRLTDSGRTLLEEKRALWRRRGAEALADVSDHDLLAAADVMHRMARLLDEL